MGSGLGLSGPLGLQVLPLEGLMVVVDSGDARLLLLDRKGHLRQQINLPAGLRVKPISILRYRR